MTNLNIAQQRLHNQHIEGTKFEKAQDVVQWMGAVQAQDYPGAKWSLGMRMQSAVDADIDQAFNDGAILRTHVLRPTWHFVTPADIRWILALTAPRIHALNAYMCRQLELDDVLLSRTNAAIAKALQGNQYLTRPELGAKLAEIGIAAEGMRLGYIAHHAELEAIICSGPRRGKQFTYALLDERAPQAKTLPHDEALTELTKRYFGSHGPGIAQDFAAWASLPIADVKAGLEMAKPYLVEEIIDGKTYWYAPSDAVTSVPSPTVHLLPTYDEYMIVLRDHSAVIDPAHGEQAKNAPYYGAIIIDGIMLGNWRRTISRGSVVIESAPFRPFTDAENEAFIAAAGRFGQFLDMPVKFA